MGGDCWVRSRSTARAHSRVDGSTMMLNPSALRMMNKASILSSSTVLLYVRGVAVDLEGVVDVPRAGECRRHTKPHTRGHDATISGQYYWGQR